MKKTMAIAAAIVVGVFGTLVAVSPAQAAFSDCPTSATGCFFEHADGGGTVYTITSSQGCKNVLSAWNDRFSSAKNNTGTYGYLMRYWENANCSGTSNDLLPGSTRTFNWLWNDEVSSYAVYPCWSVDEC